MSWQYNQHHITPAITTLQQNLHHTEQHTLSPAIVTKWPSPRPSRLAQPCGTCRTTSRPSWVVQPHCPWEMDRTRHWNKQWHYVKMCIKLEEHYIKARFFIIQLPGNKFRPPSVPDEGHQWFSIHRCESNELLNKESSFNTVAHLMVSSFSCMQHSIFAGKNVRQLIK